MRHNIDVVQRQKKELRDELERQTTALKKEIDVLNRNRDESLKKSGGQQAALDRLQKMLDSKQAELKNTYIQQKDGFTPQKRSYTLIKRSFYPL